MDGAQSLVDLMEERGHPKPKVYKRIDGNNCELSRLETNPALKDSLVHTEEGDVFNLDGISFIPVNTPGHLSDHLCFLMNENDKFSLFTGDHIIGASSTFFMDYPEYFKSLKKTQKIIYEKNIEKLYGAHTVSLYYNDVALDAKKKVDEYIDRRSKKDRELEKLADHLSKKGPFSIEQFYKVHSELKIKHSSKSATEINKDYEKYFTTIMGRQLEKLIDDGKYYLKDGQYSQVSHARL